MTPSGSVDHYPDRQEADSFLAGVAKNEGYMCSHCWGKIRHTLPSALLSHFSYLSHFTLWSVDKIYSREGRVKYVRISY
jgi:hypothetical protein